MGQASNFERDGFIVVAGLLDDSRCNDLLRLLPAPDEPAQLRRLLELPPVAQLAEELAAQPSVAALLPPHARAVQCTYFDKSADRNWSVGPHHDLSLPIPQGGAGRLPDGWRAASHKDGIDFGQPPPADLERVLAVRVQLDAMVDLEGVLEVIPGTHRRGRLDPDEIADLTSHAGRVPCPVPRGGALCLRPLLMHGSRRLRSPSRRRVLHFVFASQETA